MTLAYPGITIVSCGQSLGRPAPERLAALGSSRPFTTALTVSQLRRSHPAMSLKVMNRAKSTIRHPILRVIFVWASTKGGLLEFLSRRRVQPSRHLHPQHHGLQPDGHRAHIPPPKSTTHQLLPRRHFRTPFGLQLEDDLPLLIPRPTIPVTLDSKSMIKKALHRPFHQLALSMPKLSG